MKIRRKILTALLTAAATTSVLVLGSGAVFAEKSDFQPTPVNSDWEQVDDDETVATFENGNDVVYIYEYDKTNDKPKIARADDDYAAYYQTFFSEGDLLYEVVGCAKDAKDIKSVRAMVEHISYPGNPAIEDSSSGSSDSSDSSSDSDKSSDSSSSKSDSDKDSDDSDSGSNSSGKDSGDDSNLETVTVVSLGGKNPFTLTQKSKGSDIYVDANGTEYTFNGTDTYTDTDGNDYYSWDDDHYYHGTPLRTITVVDDNGNQMDITLDKDGNWTDSDGNSYTDESGEDAEQMTFTDENGTEWHALTDATHEFGDKLEQHTLTDSDGNQITVTHTTNGDWLYQDENGTGFADNGDGTWTDENGNEYDEVN